MKTAFILGSANISGGSYVIFEHAIRMNRRGKFKIYMVMENELNENDLFWHPEAKELQWSTFEKAKHIEFDVVIATWWVTCYEAHRLKSKSYLYFNQSVESKFYKPNNVFDRKYADSTYFLGLNVITEATWIKNYLNDKYGLHAELALNGIRKDIYKPEGNSLAKRNKKKLRVLVEGPLGVFFKNTEKTIELCLKSRADEVWLMTSTDIKKYPDVDRVFSRVPIFKTPEVYRSCDVVVKLSYVEGMFGPPLEMFHCGGTAIVYDVTGYDEYIKHDYNALVVKMDDENKVVEYINYLKDNPEKLQKLKDGALKTANKWKGWEEASVLFEKAILKSINKKQISQKNLTENILHFKEWYEYSYVTKQPLELKIHALLKKIIFFFVRGNLRAYFLRVYKSNKIILLVKRFLS